MRVAVIRLSSLGDIVHAVPAVARLRAERPGTHVTWLAEPAGARLLELFAVADEVWTARLRQTGVATRLRSLAALRAQRGRFDAVLDFQGLLKSALVARLLGGERLGFHRRNLREPAAALFYSRRAAYFPEERHVIRKNLHLLSLLGVPERAGIHFPFRPPPPAAQVDDFLAARGSTGRPWLALNVGGGWPTKVLPEARLAQTARLLQPEFNVLLLWGTAVEHGTARRVAAASSAEVAPALDFPGLLAALRRSALLVSGDTLPLHLADAAGIRCVGLFGPTSPLRNGPLLPASTVLADPQPCGFCYKRKCDTMNCLAGISPQRIVEAVRATHAKRD